MRILIWKIIIILCVTEFLLQIFSFGRYLYFFYQSRLRVENWYIREKQNKWILDENTSAFEKYHPFLGWRLTPFSTKEQNIDNEIIRRTIGNPNSDVSNIPRLFFFGGSTMWGLFAKDDETIPSYFSHLVNKDKAKVNVFNYGQIAYNSNQELILLLELLKNGHIPNFVIFYDKCNDLLTAPELVYSQSKLEKHLGNIERFLFPANIPENHSVFNLNLIGKIFSFAQRYIKIIHYPKQLFTLIYSKTMNIQHTEKTYTYDEKAGYMVENYIKNASVIDKLARSYNFEYILIWQPLIYDKILTEKEKKFIHIDDSLSKSSDDTKDRIHSMALPNFVDLSYIFASNSSTLYTDVCHVTPEANKLIGEKISELFLNSMK